MEVDRAGEAQTFGVGGGGALASYARAVALANEVQCIYLYTGTICIVRTEHYTHTAAKSSFNLRCCSIELRI